METGAEKQVTVAEDPEKGCKQVTTAEDTETGTHQEATSVTLQDIQGSDATKIDCEIKKTQAGWNLLKTGTAKLS